MKKTDMFNIIVSKTCEVCEVERVEMVNGCKNQDVVDARCIAVYFLRRTGLTNEQIAAIVLREAEACGVDTRGMTTRRKAKSIDKQFIAFCNKYGQTYAFDLMVDEVKEFCLEEYRERYQEGMKSLP